MSLFNPAQYTLLSIDENTIHVMCHDNVYKFNVTDMMLKVNGCYLWHVRIRGQDVMFKDTQGSDSVWQHDSNLSFPRFIIELRRRFYDHHADNIILGTTDEERRD